MKKIITGAAMLISGVIGFVGWFISCALTVQPGARSRVWRCLNGMEWIPVIVPLGFIMKSGIVVFQLFV